MHVNRNNDDRFYCYVLVHRAERIVNASNKLIVYCTYTRNRLTGPTDRTVYEIRMRIIILFCSLSCCRFIAVQSSEVDNGTR